MSNADVIRAIKTDISSAYLTLGLVSADDYQQLNLEAKKAGVPLYDVVKKNKVVTDHELLKAISHKYGLGYDIGIDSIEPADKSFPIKFCEKNGLALLSQDGTKIEVGLISPSSLNALKNLSLFTGKKVSAKFVLPKVIFKLLGLQELDELEDLTTARDAPGSDNDPAQEAPKKPTQRSTRPEPKELKTSESVKEQAKSFDSTSVIKAVDDIFCKAIDNGVSDIHIEVFKDYANTRFRKNGTLVSMDEYKRFLTENYVAVIARIKILANLDIAEKRLPQDGKISFTSTSGKEVDFRVSVLPTNLGERVVIRILSSSSLAVGVEDIGFDKKQTKDFVEAIEAPQGLILVTGPTGSGKSTTLYGAINYLNKPGVNILTAEDPVEYTVAGISQVQVRESIGLSFANALRSFLRQDPEIILVGEIRDAETADIATKAALTGHLVLSTLHTNSSIGAITRLINMGLAPYLVASALTLVVAQRLIRLNCPACAELEDIPSGTISEKLSNQINGRKVKRSRGCEKCFNTGYAGRRAVFEVLKVNAKIQRAINEGADENEIQSLAVEDGFEDMSTSSIKFILSGELSLEEYLRVIPQVDSGVSDAV
jgi:type IV pilus assembly protein PilB